MIALRGTRYSAAMRLIDWPARTTIFWGAWRLATGPGIATASLCAVVSRAALSPETVGMGGPASQPARKPANTTAAAACKLRVCIGIVPQFSPMLPPTTKTSVSRTVEYRPFSYSRASVRCHASVIPNAARVSASEPAKVSRPVPKPPRSTGARWRTWRRLSRLKASVPGATVGEDGSAGLGGSCVRRSGGRSRRPGMLPRLLPQD